MDWPIDMPFPIFYRKWQVEIAKEAGAEILLNREGLQTTWETLKEFKKEQDKRILPWEKMKELNLSPAALAIESAMFEYECRTFIMGKQLTAALGQTNHRDIPGELVQIPFDVIYIDLSKSKLTLWNKLSDSQEEIRGVVVLNKSNEIHKQVCLSTGYSPEKTIMGHVISELNEPTGNLNDCWGCSTLVWPELDGVYSLPSKNDNSIVVIGDPLDPETGRSCVIGESEMELWAILINSILYINSVNADIKEDWLYRNTAEKLRKAKGKRKRDLRERLNNGGKVFRVGHSIRLPQISDSEKHESCGNKLGVRFQVRGHWHTYWIGSNRFGTRAQKLKWIAPYWKGPEMAEVVHGTYVVD